MASSFSTKILILYFMFFIQRYYEKKKKISKSYIFVFCIGNIFLTVSKGYNWYVQP